MVPTSLILRVSRGRRAPRPLILCLTAVLLVVLLASAGSASAAPELERAKAVTAVKNVLRAKSGACELKIKRVTARRFKTGWRVTARVTTFGVSGRAVFAVLKAKKAVPAEPLAADIRAGCPGAKPKARRAQAISAVRSVLRNNVSACEMTIKRVTAKRFKAGWRVTARVITFGFPGKSFWTVVKPGKAVAADPLAFEISAGCP